MRVWAPKRFGKQAEVTEAEGGHGIALDGRPVKTPAKAPLVVPTRALAEALAAEWQAQEGTVRPETMPATRAANAAIDKVRPQRAEVAALIAAYGGTDLLCYRAEAPGELVDRQAAGWDPLLDWFAQAFGVRLVVTRGVLPVAQPEALTAVGAHVGGLDEWELAALHDLVGLTGSLVLGLAVAEGRLTAQDAWTLSRIDEDWQAEQWGADEEAQDHAALRRAALLDAARFWTLRHAG